MISFKNSFTSKTTKFNSREEYSSLDGLDQASDENMYHSEDDKRLARSFSRFKKETAKSFGQDFVEKATRIKYESKEESENDNLDEEDSNEIEQRKIKQEDDKKLTSIKVSLIKIRKNNWRRGKEKEALKKYFEEYDLSNLCKSYHFFDKKLKWFLFYTGVGTYMEYCRVYKIRIKKSVYGLKEHKKEDNKKIVNKIIKDLENSIISRESERQKFGSMLVFEPNKKDLEYASSVSQNDELEDQAFSDYSKFGIKKTIKKRKIMTEKISINDDKRKYATIESGDDVYFEDTLGDSGSFNVNNISNKELENINDPKLKEFLFNLKNQDKK